MKSKPTEFRNIHAVEWPSYAAHGSPKRIALNHWRNAARSAGAPFTTRAAKSPCASRRRRGDIVLTMPRDASLEAGLRFARTQSAWIAERDGADATAYPLHRRRHRACSRHIPPNRPLVAGSRPRHDELRRSGAHRSSQWRASPRFLAKRSARNCWQKEAQRDSRPQPWGHYAGTVGRPAGRIALRDTRSRWGSCTARG